MIFLIVLCAVLGATLAILVATHRSGNSKPTIGRSTAMSHVLHQHPADSPGYTRLVLREPVGHKQASSTITAYGPATDPSGDFVAHEIHLHGQREVDVPSGSIVRFPDGTDLHLDAD